MSQVFNQLLKLALVAMITNACSSSVTTKGAGNRSNEPAAPDTDPSSTLLVTPATLSLVVGEEASVIVAAGSDKDGVVPELDPSSMTVSGDDSLVELSVDGVAITVRAKKSGTTDLKVAVLTVDTGLELVAKVTVTVTDPAAGSDVDEETPPLDLTMSIPSGSYSSAQQLSLQSPVEGGVIFYTLDGSEPTAESARYEGPLTITQTSTIRAIVVKDGKVVATLPPKDFVITGQAAAPVVSIGAGTYTSAQSIALSSATAGATIYYTTDGSEPSTGSSVYVSPIHVSSSQTIKAFTVKSGLTPSSVISAAYVITGTVGAPVFSVSGGTYSSARSVSLSSTTPGATIYYTINGDDPTPASSTYTAPIVVAASMTVKAIAVKSDWISSSIAAASYIIEGTVAAPVMSVPGGIYTSGQSVALSTATDGATIYYTTNGDDPSASSTEYTGAISVSSSLTLKAIAVKAGSVDSSITTVAYTITGTVATPVMSVTPGIYTSARSVTLSSATVGASIYYTTDGSDPTASSTLYSAAINVATSLTLKAIAVKADWDDSSVATAAYTITGTVVAPTMSITAGTYTSAQSVTLSSATSGATIYYTTDGSDPTTSSTQYSSAIAVSSSLSLKAIAVKQDWDDSSIATAAYVITGTVATPAMSVGSGTYTSAQSVALSTATSGATIYYTTDGSDPTASSTQYTTPISVSSSLTLKAIAVKADWENSLIASAAYVITGTVATPAMSPSAGTYTSAQSVAISSATSGATIYYTTDGSDPTTSSTQYATPVAVSSSMTLKAIAVKADWENSSIATAAYVITGTVATPSMSVSGGTYTSAQSVAISTATSGATIYYTTDGSDPTTSSTQYSAAVSVSASMTLKAIAVKAGWDDSAVASASYTINSPPEPQSVTKSAGSAASQSLGYSPWSNLDKIFAEDGSGASADTEMDYNRSDYLKATNFGFDILDGSTILGVEAKFLRRTWGEELIDSHVKLIKDGAILGEDRSTGQIWPYGTYQWTTFGTSVDLWGEDWTTDDINSQNFGVAIAVEAPTSWGSPNIDQVQITVHYEDPDPNRVKTPQFSVSGGVYSSPVSVSITTETDGATIYYTTDGSSPTAASTLYTDPIDITSTTTLRALATKDGLPDSSRAKAVYTMVDGTSCKDILDSGKSAGDGVYIIASGGEGDPNPKEVYCDMTTDGGGWTLCFSGGHQKKGTTHDDGFNFLSSVWTKSGSYIFSTNNTSVADYGNFCPEVPYDSIFARRFSNTSTLGFSTQIMTATSNIFENGSVRLVNGSDEIAVNNVTDFVSQFYGGTSCALMSNGVDQGTSLCVSSGSNYQQFMGNLNGGSGGQYGGVGDFLCAYNQQCGNDYGSIIQLLVR